MTRSFRTIFLALVLATLLIGCKATITTETDTTPKGATLEAEVFYREKLMLPPGCTLTVRLENISKLDAPATLIAEKTVAIQAAPPFKVTLDYDPADIHDRLTYNVRARIELDDQLFFISTTHIDPFATPEGHPIQILVRKPMRLR